MDKHLLSQFSSHDVVSFCARPGPKQPPLLRKMSHRPVGAEGRKQGEALLNEISDVSVPVGLLIKWMRPHSVRLPFHLLC